MRLGRRQGAEATERRRQGRTGRVAAVAVVAFLTGLAPITVVGDPAGSADHQRRRDGAQERRFRRDGDQGRSRRDGEQERRSRRFRGEEGNGRPAQFVAERNGRIVVVSVDTGRIDRYLTAAGPGGGATEPAPSADGRTVWFSRSEGSCAAYLVSVPVAGGKEEKLRWSGEAGPEGTPLPRPGRPHIAYSRADCPSREPSVALIIGDLAGLEGHGQMGLVPLAWNRDGTRLLARAADGHDARLLAVSESAHIVDNQPLDLTDRNRECRLQAVGFSPDDNDGFVALRRCGAGESARRSLVLLGRDGNYRKTVVRLPRGEDFIDRPAFDPTGHSLLYSSAPAAIDGSAATRDPEISLWLWRDGETRVLARQSGYRHPAWLP